MSTDTLIRVWNNVDASQRSLGVLSFDPPIAVPSDTILLYRFGKTIDLSLRNLAPAPWPDADRNYGLQEDWVVTDTQLILPSSGFIAYQGHRNNFPMTTMTVIGQHTSSATLSGYIASAGDSFGMGIASTARPIAYHRKSASTLSAALDFVSRPFDFYASVFGATSMRLRRPRDGAEAVTALPNGLATDTTGSYRVLGSNSSGYQNSVGAALHIMVPRELTNSEIDAIYASAKVSLAVRSIDI